MLKFFQLLKAFLLEDAVEALLQFNYIDKYILKLNFMVAVNSAIMFVISLATFIRFLVYVIRYWKQTAHEKDKILLVFMVFIIFSIFAGKLKLLDQSWLRDRDF